MCYNKAMTLCDNTLLPTEAKELQSMVIDLYEALAESKNANQKLEKEAQHYKEIAKNREKENNILRDKLLKLIHERFAAKSEKLKKLLDDDGFEAGFLFDALKDNDSDKEEEASVGAEKDNDPGAYSREE